MVSLPAVPLTKHSEYRYILALDCSSLQANGSANDWVARLLHAQENVDMSKICKLFNAGPERDRRAALCAVAFERIGQCVLAALDKQPIDFADFLPQFLRL